MTAQTSKWTWEHAPTDWHENSGSLTQTVPAGTDYWRVTHYGFISDNGPFRYQMHGGDFECPSEDRADGGGSGKPGFFSYL
jgi:regulation of enolase protein 1 (concanavalin A-like superfamily)